MPLPTARPPRVLGLFAHPDDEVFCLGGTFAALTDVGAVTRVVSFTRGEAGEIRDARIATRRTLGDVREAELSAALATVGCADAACHRYADGTLADQPLDELVALAVAEIDEFSPDVVVSFGPDGAYGHPDHIRASEVATAAAAASQTQPAMLHAVFPRSSRLFLGLVIDWLSGLDHRFRGTEAFANGLMLFANGSSMLGFAADHLTVRFVPTGTYVVEQGEPPGELFLVLSGTADVLHEDDDDGTVEHLATLGPGSFFGEEGIATDAPRNAHVVAASGLTLFVLSPGETSMSAGRGTSSPLERFTHDDDTVPTLPPGCITVDVTEHAHRKLAALACHRSQYALTADMFPPQLVAELFGTEYFLRVDG